MAMCAYPDVTCNRQYEEKQLKGQQAREEKRLEFANLQQRLQNQLDFEKQKNPAGVCVCVHAQILYTMCDCLMMMLLFQQLCASMLGLLLLMRSPLLN